MSVNMEYIFKVLFDQIMEIRKLQEVIQEEKELREKAEKERDQAEYDRDYYARELKEEHRLRLRADERLMINVMDNKNYKSLLLSLLESLEN